MSTSALATDNPNTAFKLAVEEGLIKPVLLLIEKLLELNI